MQIFWDILIVGCLLVLIYRTDLIMDRLEMPRWKLGKSK